MDTQELIEENEFLRNEVKRCYKQIEDYEVLIDEIREFLEGML